MFSRSALARAEHPFDEMVFLLVGPYIVRLLRLDGENESVKVTVRNDYQP